MNLSGINVAHKDIGRELWKVIQFQKRRKEMAD
jgi:hypothetical protein